MEQPSAAALVNVRLLEVFSEASSLHSTIENIPDNICGFVVLFFCLVFFPFLDTSLLLLLHLTGIICQVSLAIG